jgi:hypothetical protein
LNKGTTITIFQNVREGRGQPIGTTEAERLTVERIDQNLYRHALMEKWNGRCPLSGITIRDSCACDVVAGASRFNRTCAKII